MKTLEEEREKSQQNAQEALEILKEDQKVQSNFVVCFILFYSNCSCG